MMDKKVKNALARHDDRVRRALEVAMEEAVSLSLRMLRLEEGEAVYQAAMTLLEDRANATTDDTTTSNATEAN